MSFEKNLLRALVLLCFVPLFTKEATADYEWGFGNVSLNRLYWDSSTKQKSTKTDFNYLELEGGAQYTWGETYGFFDVEEIGKRGELLRTAAKGIVRYYLGKSNISLYGHVYNFTQAGFSEQNRVYGLGYQLTGKGWWFKPFLGFHDVTQTYFNGSNGFMGGWIIGYVFKIGGEEFLAADWHELEFARKDDYAAANGNSRVGQNGAASIWWIANSKFNFGLQWRYAVNKLGTEGNLNAAILSAKYIF
jgi:hypothetical protein